MKFLPFLPLPRSCPNLIDILSSRERRDRADRCGNPCLHAAIVVAEEWTSRQRETSCKKPKEMTRAWNVEVGNVWSLVNMMLSVSKNAPTVW